MEVTLPRILAGEKSRAWVQEEEEMFRLRVGLIVFTVILTTLGLAQPEEYVLRLRGDSIEGLYISKVPDASQPPPNPLALQSVDNWCAPLAVANTIVFLDQIAGADWAAEVSGHFAPGDLSAYLGYFMATNGEGSSNRVNSDRRLPGTLNRDIPYGIMDFARWNGEPPPGRVQIRKESYSWRVEVLRAENVGIETVWEAYCESIEEGIPVILCFAFWNPIKPTTLRLASSTGDVTTIAFYLWGDQITSTTALRKEDPKIPEEYWDEFHGIGHAVTGVGFLRGDPDGRGPLPDGLWVIVHDNWGTTAERVAIPWEYVVEMVRLLPW